MSFRKLLIANRGEIAIRVAATARHMGVRTLGIFAPNDAEAAHLRHLDEVAEVPAYLDADAILDVAKERNADAVHPGYGFLSERDSFSEACDRAGIAFIGPPANAMRALGGKIAAKTLAANAGVPVLPGYYEPDPTDADLIAAAHGVGFPLLLKASAGGGGRGMRVVTAPEDLESQLRVARDEAVRSFGDGAMMVERYVARPRHIETQFLADRHGGVAVLFERECTVQRRHQKLLEEAPAARSGFDWTGLRVATIRLAQAAGYVGAGTAEFLVDPATGEFFFLEVNARLQVEHPVTEAITGLDLVAWQLRIAAGEPLTLSDALIEGERATIVGHAVEARIIAEDPDHGFRPSVGPLAMFRIPTGPGIRVDAGYEEGDVVTPHYDSLLAKVIAHGETRPAALARLRDALEETHILGVTTNVPFLLDLLAEPDFVSGNLDTGIVDRFLLERLLTEAPPEVAVLARLGVNPEAGPKVRRSGAWHSVDGFRNVRIV